MRAVWLAADADEVYLDIDWDEKQPPSIQIRQDRGYNDTRQNKPRLT
jgi:hypothetical protein